MNETVQSLDTTSSLTGPTNSGTVTQHTITTNDFTSTTQSIHNPIISTNLNSISEDKNIRIDRVAITSPKLWFSHLEAQLATGGITTDETKYYYVVAALDEQMLKLVSDIVERPQALNKYQTIRDNLIKSLSESETQQLHNLLPGMELGDRKPSQFVKCDLVTGLPFLIQS